MTFVTPSMKSLISWTSTLNRVAPRCFPSLSTDVGPLRRVAGPTLAASGWTSHRILVPLLARVTPWIIVSWWNFKTHSCYTCCPIRMRSQFISSTRGLCMSRCPTPLLSRRTSGSTFSLGCLSTKDTTLECTMSWDRSLVWSAKIGTFSLNWWKLRFSACLWVLMESPKIYYYLAREELSL